MNSTINMPIDTAVVYCDSCGSNQITDGEIVFCGHCNPEILVGRVHQLEAELRRLAKLPHSYDAPWEVAKACKKLGLSC